MHVIGVACQLTSASRGVANISLTDSQYKMMNYFSLHTVKSVRNTRERESAFVCNLCAGNQMLASSPPGKL